MPAGRQTAGCEAAGRSAQQTCRSPREPRRGSRAPPNRAKAARLGKAAQSMHRDAPPGLQGQHAATDTHGTRETSCGAGGPCNAAPKTAVKAPRPGEESDGVVVPTRTAKAVGGKGPDSMTRPLKRREWDCGNTRNPRTPPGSSTGALSASQARSALPRVCPLRQGVATGYPRACLRTGEGERRGSRSGWPHLRAD
jgi:hypothetical protein